MQNIIKTFETEYYGTERGVKNHSPLQIKPIYQYTTVVSIIVFISYPPLLWCSSLCLLIVPTIMIVQEKELGTIQQINVTPVRRLHFYPKIMPYWLVNQIGLPCCSPSSVASRPPLLRHPILSSCHFCLPHYSTQLPCCYCIQCNRDSSASHAHYPSSFILIFLLIRPVYHNLEDYAHMGTSHCLRQPPHLLPMWSYVWYTSKPPPSLIFSHISLFHDSSV